MKSIYDQQIEKIRYDYNEKKPDLLDEKHNKIYSRNNYDDFVPVKAGKLYFQCKVYPMSKCN